MKGVGVRHGAQPVLEGIDLHLHCGELTAVIGENGAGKTTLIKCLLGEMPHEGEIHFLDAAHRRPDSPVIGYVPQHSTFDKEAPVSVLDLFAASLASRPACLGVARAVREEALAGLRRTGAGDLVDRRVGTLSGGELQRVLLGLALTPVPNILLLDEPMSGVDHNGREQFYALLSRLRREYDFAVLLVSHDLAALARFADRLVFLDRRIVCEGRPAEVLQDPRVREAFSLHSVA
ncbi:MAG: metal ABC transporter ATP-binding protein [Chthoniobacterales bacterium]|jgi:zinc transport system ATP-binding protein